MKTTQDNDLIDRACVVYAENNTKLLRPIRPGAIYDKTRKVNNVTDLPHSIYAENKIKLSWPIGPGAICHEN